MTELFAGEHLLHTEWSPSNVLVNSAPLGYLTRPYVVYLSRDINHPGARRYARAWETSTPRR